MIKMMIALTVLVGTVAQADVITIPSGVVVVSIDRNLAQQLNANLTAAPFPVQFTSGPGTGIEQTFSSATVICSTESNGNQTCQIQLNP